MAKPVEQEELTWISDARSRIEREITQDLESRDTRNSEAALTFDEVMRLNMGAFMPPTAWVKQRRDGELRDAQTEAFAEALEGQGIAARRESNIVRIDDVTGEITKIPAYRNICFFPSVAKRNRREQMLDIEYYMKKVDPNGGKYWRYIVLTFGERDKIPAFGELKDAKRAAQKMVARWRERVLKPLGAQVGFVGWEYPRDEETGTYHLHANVLLLTPFWLDGGAEFREKTTGHFGEVVERGDEPPERQNYWWRDNGRMQSVEELVKYPFKPNSLAGADDEELAWLFHETFNQRVTNILGPISEWRKSRKDRGLKVFRMKQEIRLRFVCNISAEDNCFDDDPSEREDVGSGGENVIVGREAPSFRNGLWATSGTLVWNFNSIPAQNAIKSRRRLDAMCGYWADARADYVASGAPDPEVARKIRDAALAGENGETNLRALWRSQGANYIVHNDTISSHGSDEDSVIDFEDEWDPPPNNVIPLR